MSRKECTESFWTLLCPEQPGLTIANGLEKPDADLGPMANRAGREKTMRHVADALGKGAHVAFGGHVPEGKAFQKGYFYLPTILTDVTHTMLVMSEETFGPVVGVMPYRSLDEAIEWANSTPYGLAAYAYTEDLGEADELCSALHARQCRNQQSGRGSDQRPVRRLQGQRFGI